MDYTFYLSYRNLHILNVLGMVDSMNSEELADLCGVSSRTMRSNLQVLMSVMQNSGASLVIKKGQGYSLLIDDSQRYHAFLNRMYQSLSEYTPDYPEERVLHLLFQLLDQKVLYRKQLLEDFVINASTLAKHLRRLSEILASYRLTLIQENRDNDICYYIEGQEFDFRLCMIYRSMWYGFPVVQTFGGEAEEFHRLSEFVHKVLQEEGLLVKKVLFHDLLISIYIGALRARKGKSCMGFRQNQTGSKDLQGFYLRPVAVRIADWIRDQLNIPITEDEILYLQIMLAAKSDYGDYILSHNHPIPEEIHTMLEDACDILPERVQYFLRHSYYRRYELYQLLVPMSIRLQQGIYIFHPELRRRKLTMPLSYQSAQLWSSVFRKISKIPLYDEELCLLAEQIEYHRSNMEEYMMWVSKGDN